MQALKKVILFTDTDGRARFRDEEVPLTEGTPQSRLSALMAASACQLRQSPVGFRSTFHCTGHPQWCRTPRCNSCQSSTATITPSVLVGTTQRCGLTSVM